MKRGQQVSSSDVPSRHPGRRGTGGNKTSNYYPRG